MGKKKKSARGGRRDGAGRKPTYQGETTVTFGLTVPVSMKNQLDEIASRQRKRRSHVIVELLEKAIGTRRYPKRIRT